ncbi:hypothetical protein DESUT3_26440 [Desulfuromonas versatilis]|uniref:Tetratricopeptide repeat protein n=1 Tax=Desulfuromonas versatilis TaxID=2802975 RepID=A0ABN6DZU4_9BACT|nr:hypothetical protein [Desulfuromonas versatilis]BCR05575.1 hypothetical protein DESUT3_26440 [Desulfuromonas versatilis]
MKNLAVLIALFGLLLSGCEKKTEPVATPAPPEPAATQASSEAVPVMSSAIEPVLVELPTEAISTWQRHAQARPELVLFSIHPFLDQIPETVKSEALAMVKRGDARELRAHGSFFREAPLLLPTQTLRAALEAGFFSQVTWVFPSKVKIDELSLETFSGQVVEAGFLTEEEGRQLVLAGGVFEGQVQGIPFRAVHPFALPDITAPALIHVDLGYFKGMYQDEVKTPLYDLLHGLAISLRDMGWKVLDVTLSYSTIEGVVSLDTRFLLTNLAELFRKPEMLQSDMPELWRMRAEALYGADMFQPQKMKEMHQKAAELAPGDATAQYDLYKIQFENREIDAALETLDRVVAMDSGYGAAYLDLSQVAMNDKNPTASLVLLEKAAMTFPDNPFINLSRSDILLQMDEKSDALELLKPLKQLAWSAHYHADIPGLIETMEKAGMGKGPGPESKESSQ